MKKILSITLRLFYKILTIIFTFLVKIKAKEKKGFIKANGFTRLNNNTFLGNNVHFNGLEILGDGKVVIGDNFHSGKGTMFLTDIHDYNGLKLPYDDNIIKKEIIIGNNVWIGARVTIIGNCRIGDGAIIQAGSVVVSNVDNLAIVGGSPAKQFSKRNEKHYNSLLKNVEDK